MPADILINGVRLPAGCKRGSLAVNQRTGQRHTCDFTYDAIDVSLGGSAGAPIPVEGQSLRVVEQPGNNVIFGGVVQVVGLNGVRIKDGYTRRFKVSGMDYRWLAERRNAGEHSWQGQYAGQIFREIVEESLGGDGIDLTEVLPTAGPLIKEFKLDFPSVAQALDRLVELWPGSAWWFDYDKKARFEEIDLNTPTWLVDSNDPPVYINSLEVERTRESYANAVIVRLAKYETEQLTAIYSRFGDSQQPDGTRRDWNLPWPLSRPPVITVDGVTQSVGVKNLDVGVQWFWEQGSNVISQNPTQPVLTNLKVLQVLFVGLASQTVYLRDEAEISAVGAAEGNAGVHQILVAIDSIVARGDAEETAAAVLASRKQLGRRLTLKTTWRKDSDTSFRPKPGDVIRVDRQPYQAASFVVESVSITELGDGGGHLVRTIQGRSGPVALDSVRFFSAASGSVSGSASGSAVTGGAAAGRPRYHALAAAAAVDVDLANGITQELTWDRDIHFNQPGGAIAGEELVLIIRKDATDDARDITFHASWLVDPEQIDARANAVTVLHLIFDRDLRAVPAAPYGKTA
jgi:hypothetical protein